ncbi:hypothetical protein EJB05_44209, partial [Eragrostis curvula]
MADAGVTGVVAKLGELAAAEATSLLRVDTEIRALRRKLAYLQALVRGADRQRRGRASELLLLWLRETREVAFEVEDAVDEFHLRVEDVHIRAKRRRRGWWGWHLVAVDLVQGLAAQVVVRHGLSNQILKINERINELNENKETYEIESFPSEIWSSSSVETDPEWYEDGYVVGSRQSEFAILKDQIINKEENAFHRAVISILGESGIGKTTLAKRLYHHPDIMRHFEVHAWVCLPPHIRFEDYIEIMYMQVSSQVPEAPKNLVPFLSDDGEITNKEHILGQHLRNRRFLVVLDGLANSNDWNSLFDVLPDDKNGSRILFTSRLNVKEINHIDPQIAPLELACLDITHGEELRLAVHNYVDAHVQIPNSFPKLRSLLCDFAEDQRSSSVVGGLRPQTLWGSFAELCLRACGISEGTDSKTLHGLHFLEGSRFLRVIDLNGLQIQRLPDEIGSIIHLRYLGIRNSNLDELPTSISNLDNLQTLDVRRTNIGNVADEFWEIEALRHVLAEKMLLPRCSIPLNNLMTLNGVVPSDSWDEEVCPLDYMICLRSLSLSGISELHCRAVSASLKKLEFLVYLNLSGIILPSNMFIDSSTRRLQVLILHGRLEGLNDLLSDRYILPNLHTLRLNKSELSQLFIDKLARLPCLAEMELLDGSYNETALVFPERGFQSLKNLKLRNLYSLQALVIEQGAMPMLSILAMYGCDNLRILNGLTALEHLQEVVLYNMEEIVDTIKLVDKKLFDKVKCLTTPRMGTDRGVAGTWIRKAVPKQFVDVASESRCGGLERTDSVIEKTTDDIGIHYGSGAWIRSFAE